MSKLNITINEDLLARLEAYSEENYISKSALVSQAVLQYLNAQEVFGLVDKMSLAFEKIADKGNISTQDADMLEDLQRSCNLILKAKR